MPEFAPAGFWKRVGATAIDLTLIYLLTVLAITLPCVLFQLTLPQPDCIKVADVILSLTVFLLIAWLYFALAESSARQATLGKRALRIMVMDYHGQGISFFKATVRFWGKVFSGFFLAASIFKKQALHDGWTGTLVVTKSALSKAGKVGWRCEPAP
jgi:uncharacterized RDD family membrane protein YckC